MQTTKLTTMNDYPLILNVSHVAEILGFSKKATHELMNSDDFPLLRIGRCKRVTKEAFFQWIEDHSGQLKS
ncbi:helix-turn-helix domain-containing protein [Bacillus massilinigeriensis]|uniref:helix-turn-helix domain-containing protein n=1 Tax=Bacillus massilionigeriensis TaxID=1805475 RepID=UPI00096B42F7|nr:helix-turn-helix domain-containing protein [Bacillus massilionigeriensis]